MRSWHFLALSLAFALPGCTELVPPTGAEPYEYRIFLPPGGESPIEVSFRWPRASLPITVYLPPGSPLAPSLSHGLASWQDAFVYGEVRFSMVPDSIGADIIVSNDSPLPGNGLQRLSANADGCFGSTDYDADFSAGLLRPPFRISISSFTTTDPAVLAACFRSTMVHELGHALGIFAHSPNSGDVMNSNPTRDDLSPRDRATIVALYHLPHTTLVLAP